MTAMLVLAVTLDDVLGMSPNLDHDELWRLAGVLDVVVLFAAGLYLHLGYRAVMPAHLWRAGIAIGIFIATIAVGFTANWLSPFPPTPGAKITASVGACCALYVARTAVRVARHRV